MAIQVLTRADQIYRQHGVAGCDNCDKSSNITNIAFQNLNYKFNHLFFPHVLCSSLHTTNTLICIFGSIVLGIIFLGKGSINTQNVFDELREDALEQIKSFLCAANIDCETLRVGALNVTGMVCREAAISSSSTPNISLKFLSNAGIGGLLIPAITTSLCFFRIPFISNSGTSQQELNEMLEEVTHFPARLNSDEREIQKRMIDRLKNEKKWSRICNISLAVSIIFSVAMAAFLYTSAQKYLEEIEANPFFTRNYNLCDLWKCKSGNTNSPLFRLNSTTDCDLSSFSTVEQVAPYYNAHTQQRAILEATLDRVRIVARNCGWGGMLFWFMPASAMLLQACYNITHRKIVALNRALDI